MPKHQTNVFHKKYDNKITYDKYYHTDISYDHSDNYNEPEDRLRDETNISFTNADLF